MLAWQVSYNTCIGKAGQTGWIFQAITPMVLAPGLSEHTASPEDKDVGREGGGSISSSRPFGFWDPVSTGQKSEWHDPRYKPDERMSQRRKADDEWVWSISRLVALLLTTALIYPPFRQNIPPVGLIFVGVLVVLLVGGGLLNFVRSAFPGSSQGFTATPLQSSFWTKPPDSTYLPQSTYELLRQLREGDAALASATLAKVYRKLDYQVNQQAGVGAPLIMERQGVKSALEYVGAVQGKAGVRLVRAFRDSLTKGGLDRGILIVSQGFTGQARKLAATCGIELLDESDLGRILEATRAGHDTEILAALPNSRPKPPARNDLPALTISESVN